MARYEVRYSALWKTLTTRHDEDGDDSLVVPFVGIPDEDDGGVGGVRGGWVFVGKSWMLDKR